MKWLRRTILFLLALVLLGAAFWHFYKTRYADLPSAPSTADPAGGRPITSGNVIDLGEFSILVPGEWHAFPVQEEEDPDSHEKVILFRTDCVILSRVARGVKDFEEAPYYFFTILPPSAQWDDSRAAGYAVNPEAAPLTLETGDLVWEGYRLEGSDPAAVLWTRRNDRIFRVELFHEDPAVLEDPENFALLDVLSSVTPCA